MSLTEAVTEDLQQKYDDALSIRDSAKSTLENNTANLDALMRENGQKLQQLQLWEAKLASAEVDLADAEDREGQHIPPLNVRDLVEELTGLDSALDAASGASREVQKFIEAWDADGTPNLSSPTLQSLLESKRVPEDLAEKRTRKSEVQAEITRRQNAHATATRNQRTAADNAASSRALIRECNTMIRSLRMNLGADAEARISALKGDVASDKTAYEEAEARLAPLQAEMDAATSGDDEVRSLNDQISTLDEAIASARSMKDQVFALYLPSVGMHRSEEMEFSIDGAERMFAHLDGEGNVESATTLVERHLNKSGNELQSILREQFTLGTLTETLPGLLSYSMRRAEEHRSKAGMCSMTSVGNSLRTLTNRRSRR